MVDQETQYGVLRLKSKEARAAIVQKLGSDFNLAPIIAEAYYQQVSQYFPGFLNPMTPYLLINGQHRRVLIFLTNHLDWPHRLKFVQHI